MNNTIEYKIDYRKPWSHNKWGFLVVTNIKYTYINITKHILCRFVYIYKPSNNPRDFYIQMLFYKLLESMLIIFLFKYKYI